MPLADWIIPWAAPHLLGASAKTYLLDAARGALEKATRASWHPSDDSACAVFAPWRCAWATEDWAAVLGRAVVPPLAAALREARTNARGPLNPSSIIFIRETAHATARSPQNPVVWAARWSQGDLLPPVLLDALWGGEFWPGWVEGLALGLGLLGEGGRSAKRPPPVSAANGAAWYQEWLAALPRAVVDSPSGRRARHAALTLLDAAATLDEEGARGGGGGGGGGDARLAAAERLTAIIQSAANPNSTSFARARDASAAAAAVSMRGSAAAAAHTFLAPTRERPLPQGASTAAALSFREVVESAAAEAGVGFIPHPRRAPVDGNPIFLFGEIPLYVLSGVVFADKARSGIYAPTSLDALLLP